MSNSKVIKIMEVGPRDGLQNEKELLSTEVKLEFIKLLIASGIKNIEVTSFVKKTAIPQMADAKELYQEVAKINDVNFCCLVPNMKGLDTALKLGVKEIAIFSATSNTFNKKNINATIDESLTRLEPVIELAKKENIKVRGYLSTVFGCPYEGKTSVDEFRRLCKWMLDRGCYEVSVGDTIGAGTPLMVRNLLEDCKKSKISMSELSMHFHDTRGMALANTLEALNFGVLNFDSSSGAIGGCPYALGATGNVGTEDLIYLLHSLGFSTGIDFKKLTNAGKYISEKLGGEISSKVLKAYLSNPNFSA